MSRKTGLPRYVCEDRQRDGRVRLLYRRDGRCVTLPGPRCSEAFWAAYAALMSDGAPAEAKSTRRPREGELGAAAEGWYRSAGFRAGDVLTQADKRGVIEAILAEPLKSSAPDGLTYLTCPLSSLTIRHIAALRDRKAGAPNAANKRLRYLRMLLDWCVETGRLKTNPAVGVKRVAAPKGGYRTWSVDEVRAYLDRHPPGTMARLAIMILLLAGLRRSDAVTLGRQHLREGWIDKPQVKNRTRHPKTIAIPILPPLAEEIARTARPNALALLTTEAGEPYSIKGFGQRFRKWCDSAGLPAGCTAHGLRKIATKIIIDNGGTEAQAMAIGGWEDADEVRTYAAARDRRKLAEDGMRLLFLPEQIKTQISAQPKPCEDLKKKAQ